MKKYHQANPEFTAEDRERLAGEFELLKEAMGGFKFAATKPYWTTKEKKAKGSGGLFFV